jgi:hypothetical protein
MTDTMPHPTADAVSDPTDPTDHRTTAGDLRAGDVAAGDVAERARDRLTVLRHELQLGETRLRELDREQAQVQQTVLRISGAIQVLDELLGTPSGAAG